MQDQFQALHADTEAQARNLAHRLAEGALTPLDFGHAMADLLTQAHTQAVVLGRWHAGDHALEEADDRRFALSVMEGTEDRPGQFDYLAGFVDDLAGDRYRDEDGRLQEAAVARRAASYSAALLGTANEVWGLTLPPEVLYSWILGAHDEANCSDCPELAARGPWTAAEMPTWPGLCETQCLWNCRCHATASTGEAGFRILG